MYDFIIVLGTLFFPVSMIAVGIITIMERN